MLMLMLMLMLMPAEISTRRTEESEVSAHKDGGLPASRHCASVPCRARARPIAGNCA